MSGRKLVSGRWIAVPLGLSLSLLSVQSGTAAAHTTAPITCVSYDQSTWWAFGQPHDIIHGETPLAEYSGYTYDYTQFTNSGMYHQEGLYGTIAAEHNVVAPVNCS